MAQESERIKNLVAARNSLERKVESLEVELKEQKALLETINSLLLEKGFKRAEMPKESLKETKSPGTEETFEPEHEHREATEEFLGEIEDVVVLKSADDDVLASLALEGNSLHILPASDKSFDVNTPPFMQFLVDRILAKMQERDAELARAGRLSPDRMFSYNIVREGTTLREVVVKNIDDERLRELKSSVRWTFEKMYDKMKTQT